jgi:hypothetical protein
MRPPVVVPLGDAGSPRTENGMIHSRVCLGAFLILVLGIMTSCSKSPMSPVRAVALNLSISNFGDIHSSLLGASSNEIYYHVQGEGASDSFGVYGPFSAPASTGTVDFTVQMPGGVGPRVLNLQLNDATGHQPFAMGAVEVDPSAAPVSDLVVELGSVTRNCYFTDESRFASINQDAYGAGSAYGFAGDNLISGNFAGPAYDIGFNCPLGAFYMMEAQDNTTNPSVNAIAYLGTGKWVDYDGVPPDSEFFPLSTQAKKAKGAPVSTLQADDVYCVKLATMPGHAWLQITDPGNMAQDDGPSFRFRVNSALPYYAYDETAVDAGGGTSCSASW